MLDLSNITLWSCVWTKDEALLDRTFRVMRYCCSIAKFGEVILFSHSNPNISSTCGWKIVKIPEMDMGRWNIFVNREVVNHISTPFALSVHEDGFILDPSLWTDDFTKVDYIGAPWDDGVVGNQGFCLESKKMLEMSAQLPAHPKDAHIASDLFVCRQHRKRLESLGAIFASTELAERFSTELTGHEKPSFGFHGRNAIRNKYLQGWGLVEQSEKPSSVALVFPFVISPLTKEQEHRMVMEAETSDERRMEFDDCSKRFVETYSKFQSGFPHKLYVVCSGKRDSACEAIFKGVDVEYDQYDGGGWDIGAEQYMAGKVREPFIVSMTTRTHFARDGWLKKLMDARFQYGEGLYGSTGSYERSAHIRTAFYGVDTWMFREYPHIIDTREKGFRFESGEWSFTKFIQSMGYPTLMVTWDGIWSQKDWRKPKNGFRTGNQSNLIAKDRHTIMYDTASESRKEELRRSADGL